MTNQNIGEKLRFGLKFARGICPLLLAALLGQACLVDQDPDERPDIPTSTNETGLEVDKSTEAFNSEAYRAFLIESSKSVPDLEQYEHIGFIKPNNSDIWIHEEAPAASLDELLKGKRRARTKGASHDASPGLLVAADGRVFLERPEFFEQREREIARMPPSGMSRGAANYGDEAEGATAKPLDNFEGSDNRTPVTSSSYPTRAVGVSILRQSGSGWSRGAGSAAMVGPRAALTAAHVISSDGSSFNVLGVAPAARGFSYCSGGGSNNTSTCKFPYGIRFVQWYYWPSDWNGSGSGNAHDYGVVILDDQNWSPGSVGFGYQTTSWLNYREMDHAGYPSPSKSCTNAIDADGECGGYMYRQTADTNAVLTNTAYYDFDVQEGQSGAPIYDITSSTGRVVYLIHTSSGGGTSRGKRIRSGSYNSICNWIGNWPSSHFSNVSC